MSYLYIIKLCLFVFIINYKHHMSHKRYLIKKSISIDKEIFKHNLTKKSMSIATNAHCESEWDEL